jgi:multisubunit Na+/H+ antiporter MnhG subunit
MIEWIRFAIAAILMILALCSFIAAVTGAYRFGFVMNRMHSSGIGDTFGLFFIMLGLGVYEGISLEMLKMVLLVTFMWFSSPVSKARNVNYLTRRLSISNSRKPNQCRVYPILNV